MRELLTSKTLGTLLIAAGLAAVLLPVAWSIRASILQAKEARAFEAQMKAAAQRPAAPRRTPGPEALPPCRIVIPKLHLDAVVVEGTRESDLDRGPMHLAGTGLPGEPGNCCIAAHKEKWFKHLRKLAKGDTVVLRTPGYRFTYTVTRRMDVRATEVSLLAPTREPVLTLITCTGIAFLGPGKDRLVVRASRTSAEALIPRSNGR